MKADEIRAIELDVDGSYGKDDNIQLFLQEIAAQLAELNERLQAVWQR